MRLTVLATLVALATLAATAAPALAYPRFQLSTGAATCQECHVSPAGGGLLEDYGRLEAGDTISRGGDGALLHGLWAPPSWLRLGGDLRGAGLVKQRRGEREVLAFPMQLELDAAVVSHGVTVYVAAGLRGGARDPQPALVERLASREHYVMYRRGNAYVRAGRFFPIFGLRGQDHTAYVRRYLGFGVLEEPYGVAAGRIEGRWEAHVHVYRPRPVALLGAGPKASGVVLTYERRFAEGNAAIGAQARLAKTEDDTRVTSGFVGKRWFETAGLLLHGELDLQRQGFAAVDAPRWQLATYLGASQRVTQGLWLGAGLQRWQPDLGLRSSRDAFDLDLQYLPRAHVELHLLGRMAAQGNDLDHPDALALLQLHYYL